jgi:hypothetical protein
MIAEGCVGIKNTRCDPEQEQQEMEKGLNTLTRKKKFGLSAALLSCYTSLAGLLFHTFFEVTWKVLFTTKLLSQLGEKGEETVQFKPELFMTSASTKLARKLFHPVSSLFLLDPFFSLQKEWPLVVYFCRVEKLAFVGPS